ncbi:MAG TPA: D-hexose-6-phosphate mutarotase [Usitatibacter sp.]|nr:D-hexose-6-phosphate mutarotase [Usitatibacter sp.]
MALGARSVEFRGLSAVELRAADGASAIVTLQGAHVVSWIPAGGAEQLFVSARSDFAPGRSIRGGIPVVFPQFSKRGPLPQHGFARTHPWRMAGEGLFALEDDEATRALWPHAFAAEIAVTLGGARLDLELRVRNTGAAEFSFTAALHTYLRVSDIARVRLEGLAAPSLVPIDQVFAEAPREVRLVDASRTVAIAQRGFHDSVVWNPGPEGSASRRDMEPGDYRIMLCVEAGAVEVPVVLAAGAEWAGGQTLTAS